MWIVALYVAAAPGLSWDDAIAAADSAPAVTAATQTAEAHAHASTHRPWIESVRVEVQPGLQATPLSGHLASAAGQMVLEATTSPATLLGIRRSAARDTAAAAAAEGRRRRHERRLAVHDAWCALTTAQYVEAAADTAVADAEALLARLEGLSARDEGSWLVDASDVVAARALVAELGLERLNAEAQRLEAALALAQLLGLDGVPTAAGPLPALSPSPLPLALADAGADVDDDAGAAAAELTDEINRGHEVQAAEAVALAARAALEAFEAEQGPSFGFGLQAQVDDASTGFAYGRFSVTLPRLGGDPAGRAAIAAVVYEAQAAVVEARRARLRSLALMHHELEHQSEAARLLHAQVLPAASARLSVAEKRHRLGEGSIVELVAAARAKLDAERRAQVAVVERAHAAGVLMLEAPGLSTHADHHPPPSVSSSAPADEHRITSPIRAARASVQPERQP